ncbi:MAG: Inosine/uridine-preferring nucleoside hydrolase [Amnibacterium sp.]|nr:Inosine/uridine-preferring nucleoside hydrolase [Amnibacterium sp.]
MRVALDTDIGTDVDDLLALATILGSPELELAAVTTVYGDTLHRARMVAKVLRIAGAPHVPIVPGLSAPASGREVWWAGHEGRLLGDLTSEAVDEGMDAGETLAGVPTVIGIGPLTNVAQAVLGPHQGLQRLVLMGGDFASGGTEHNLRSDAASAAAVFAADTQTLVVGIEQTERVHVRPQFLDDLAGRGELGALLAAEVEQYQEFSGGRPSVPHDVVAVLLGVAPELFTLARGHISVVPSGPDEGRVDFASDPAGPHSIVTDLDPREIVSEMERRILRVAASARA